MLRNLIKLDHAGQYEKVKFSWINFGVLPKSLLNKFDIVSVVDRIIELENVLTNMTNMMLKHDSEIRDLHHKLEMLTNI